MNDYKIVTNPTKKDLNEIMGWLKEEYELNGEGFYCNRNIISSEQKVGTLIVFKIDNSCVGFVVWGKTYEFVIDINIFVIHPDYRGKNFGRIFYNLVRDRFKNDSIKVFKLFCEPASSERFWKKMGFYKLPKFRYSQHELTYYSILADTASSNYIEGADIIELWDVEPVWAEDVEPKWIWYVEIKNNELILPIVHPCDCNWQIRWSRNGKVLKEEKVKYFTKKNFEFYYDKFLIISDLKNVG